MLMGDIKKCTNVDGRNQEMHQCLWETSRNATVFMGDIKNCSDVDGRYQEMHQC
jgi:hypothetical protein